MIKVESITITEFRGIRSLTLSFNNRNFAICGPNGTGKSGVVDALEFVLTGNISRLSGEGSGEVSLKDHGPHVDIRANPENACVKAVVAIPSLSKTVIIERDLKKPNSPRITPDDPKVLDVLQQVQLHPEIMLSRREIIRYVLATPGDRANEVQTLLHLDQVDKVRAGLLKIANAREKQLLLSEAANQSACDNLLRALGISTFSEAKVLEATNAKRAILGLPQLTELIGESSLNKGIDTPIPAKPQSISKAQAIADISAAKSTLAELACTDTATTAAEAVSEFRLLADDPEVASAIERDLFYEQGMTLIGGESCPFCDIEWDVEALKKRVQAKIDHLKQLSARRKETQGNIVPLITLLAKTHAAVKPLATYGELAILPSTTKAISDYAARCGNAVDRLNASPPIEEAIRFLAELTSVPQSVHDAIDELNQVVEALPEPTQQDAARDWLTVVQERYSVLYEVTRKADSDKKTAVLARQVSDIYGKTSDSVLVGIYSAVEKDFASLYASVHRGDEESFMAQLTPSLGKLGFGVDFYGRGLFPPGAYHSEGHQDNMGLCLYLALMRHLHGSAFTFAVLDDVLMSVDAGHRREVCTLLKSEFPNTQIIMTTHDPIWLRHMKTERLIQGQSSVRFRGWDVEHGPVRWDDKNVWAEIEDYLNKNDVRSAAALLRHYLEYISRELCHRLRAPVEFHDDDRYELGELLPAAIRKLNRLFGKAKNAAHSWGQIDIEKEITERASTFTQLVAASNVEQWQVNAAIHYNSWGNLVPEDFTPVAKVFRELLEGFTCPKCHTYYSLLLDQREPQSLCCNCGNININLRKKET